MPSILRTLKTRPQRLYAWLASGFWAARGRRALGRGEIPLAVKALEQAASWRPDAFRPLLLLAAAYLRAHETWRAHRALARARETAPVRFARLAPGLLAREGVDPDTLGRVLMTAPRSRAESKVPTAAHRVDAARTVGAANHPYGDCQDLDEYARFQAMPPISRAEIAALDWDHLFEDLLDD